MKTKYTGKLYYIILFYILLQTIPYSSTAQIVWENSDSEIYNYLTRLSQKGLIDFDDIMRPVSRKLIVEKLNEIQTLQSQLNSIEKQELSFYMVEYSEFDANQSDTTILINRDQAKRLRVLTVKHKDFLLRGDPSFTFGVQRNTRGTSYLTGTGLKLWGHIGKNIGFQAYYQDITETGMGFDSLRSFTAKPGVVRIHSDNKKRLNYTDFRGNITYNWHNGSIAVGMDKILWGHGQNGRIVLSDKAPAYPFIRLDYKPVDWLSFNYTHMWLQSGIIDSTRSYPKGNDVYGENREMFVPKFMASHSLNFFPVKGLSFSLGESIIYSDQLEIGYLFPLMFFKIWDQYAGQNKINAGANAQFFFQVSSRNNIKNTHLYGTLFIDEIRMASVFDKEKNRNQLGYTLGASVADLVLDNLSFGLEYTKINPFAYKNLLPAQTYENQGHLMGDWMGDNADRFIAYIEYTPIRRLKTALQFQKLRKGFIDSVEEQYFAEPQPAFLTNLERKDNQLLFKISYQWIQNLYIDAQYKYNDNKNIISNTTIKPQQLEFKIRIGL